MKFNRKGKVKMEIRQISTNWYGIYDNAKRKFIIESTRFGIEIYGKLFNLSV